MLRSHLGAKCLYKQKEQEHNTGDTIMELARQEQDGPRICSDFLFMSEAGVATPMLALKFSRSGRTAATALEQKGLTQYGVKFFAGFIQQTGVRRFINKSDGEPAMKSSKDAAAKALERVESIGQESPVGRSPSEWCRRVSSEDAKGADESHEVWTGEQAGQTACAR